MFHLFLSLTMEMHGDTADGQGFLVVWGFFSLCRVALKIQKGTMEKFLHRKAEGIFVLD